LVLAPEQTISQGKSSKDRSFMWLDLGDRGQIFACLLLKWGSGKTSVKSGGAEDGDPDQNAGSFNLKAALRALRSDCPRATAQCQEETWSFSSTPEFHHVYVTDYSSQ
jgi:hypothetical protein